MERIVLNTLTASCIVLSLLVVTGVLDIQPVQAGPVDRGSVQLISD